MFTVIPYSVPLELGDRREGRDGVEKRLWGLKEDDNRVPRRDP